MELHFIFEFEFIRINNKGYPKNNILTYRPVSIYTDSSSSDDYDAAVVINA